jgi:hypothetical protein
VLERRRAGHAPDGTFHKRQPLFPQYMQARRDDLAPRPRRLASMSCLGPTLPWVSRLASQNHARQIRWIFDRRKVSGILEREQTGVGEPPIVTQQSSQIAGSGDRQTYWACRWRACYSHSHDGMLVTCSLAESILQETCRESDGFAGGLKAGETDREAVRHAVPDVNVDGNAGTLRRIVNRL